MHYARLFCVIDAGQAEDSWMLFAMSPVYYCKPSKKHQWIRLFTSYCITPSNFYNDGDVTLHHKTPLFVSSIFKIVCHLYTWFQNMLLHWPSWRVGVTVLNCIWCHITSLNKNLFEYIWKYDVICSWFQNMLLFLELHNDIMCFWSRKCKGHPP